MKHRLLSCMMALVMAFSMLVPSYAATASQFPDFVSAAWYNNAVSYMVGNGVMIGTDQGLLEPDRNITRAEFSAMINRFFQTYKATDITKFTDSNSSAWYYNDLAMSYQMGTMIGISDSEMSPNASLTRQEAMTVISRILAYDAGDASVLSRFTDGDTTTPWAIPYVTAMVEHNRVQGYPDGSLRPTGYVTRAEVAQMLTNCFPNLLETDTVSGTYTENTVLRGNSEKTIDNAVFEDSLIIAPGVADSVVYISNTDISRLICWGAQDIYIEKRTCNIDEIIVKRRDGECNIHWVEPTVYFDPMNGEDLIPVVIDEAGYIQPPQTPTYDGYVFGGWYLDKEYKDRFSFTHKATDGMTLYAKWYTEDEYEIVQMLNEQASKDTVSVRAETDLFALTNGTSIPCSIYNKPTNQFSIRADLLLNGTVIASVDSIAPGETATSMTLVQAMPSYGNYEVTLRVTPIGAGSYVNIDGMLYVAEMWAR